MLAATLAAAALAAAHPCQAPLPQGPSVPAPIVLWTSCGSFRLAPDGAVRRLPRHWLAAHSSGTGRRYGAHLELRRNRAGRYFLLLHDRLVWRSHGLYPNDGGSIAFGPREFAFASYRRGIFVTDLKGRERPVVRGRGLYPYDFTRNGDLIVSGGRTITVVSTHGVILRRIAYRLRNGLSFDERTDSLYFVTPEGVLARLRGAHVERARSVRQIDGLVSAEARKLLIFTGPHTITVTTRDGMLLARTRWRAHGLSSDAGVSTSPDGSTFAFRLSDAYPGAKSGSATVYVLRAGRRQARALYTHRLGPSGCAYGATLSWHGRSLLYRSSEGRVDVLDPASGAVLDLGGLARELPHRSSGERAFAAWRSDFQR